MVESLVVERKRRKEAINPDDLVDSPTFVSVCLSSNSFWNVNHGDS